MSRSRSARPEVAGALAIALLAGVLTVAATTITVEAAGALAPAAGTAQAFQTRGIDGPAGIAAGPDGQLWFANQVGNSIGRMTTEGVVSTFTSTWIRDPRQITAGPDGALWFTNGDSTAGFGQGSIGRITTAGVVSSFTASSVRDPGGIAAGPDGALWFTNTATDSIGRITTAGVITAFSAPGLDEPRSIAAGPDGALWFTSKFNNFFHSAIGRITTAGVVTLFTHPQIQRPESITAGPDGNLWYTNSTGSVGRMTPSGAVTTFSDPWIGQPAGIAAGPDGALWFANTTYRDVGSVGPAIGRITTTGAVSFFSTPGVEGPRRITSGPGGALWFTDVFLDSVDRITTAGAITTFAGANIDDAYEIVTGPDGALWFTNNRNNTIGRITTTGAVSAFGDPGIDGPQGLTVGPDGALWFTNNRGNSIGRITTAGAVTTFHDPAVLLPRGIVSGPDGALWFGNYASVGRITTGGVITTVATPGFGLPGITVGPDGALWFTNPGDASIGRVTTDGVLNRFADPAIVSPVGITAGPDGALWFTNGGSGSGAIGRITTAGAVTSFADPVVNDPQRIAVGQDGALWFGNAGGSVGRITMAGALAGVASPAGIGTTRGVTAGPDGAMWFTGVESYTSSGRHAVVRIAVVGAPGAPLDVHAEEGRQAGTVSWRAPLLDGASAITAYTVTASPGGTTCTWTSGPLSCTMALTAGVKYRFTVTATNADGSGPVSAVSNAIVPFIGAGFHAMAPFRALDSRTAVGGFGGPLVAGQPRDLAVVGAGGIPATAVAVVINVTATNSTAGSFLTAWPSGSPQPAASNLNFAAGQTIANLVTVQIGAGGAVRFATAVGAVDVVGDIVGYYDDVAPGGDRVRAFAPHRIFDSRVTSGGPGPIGVGTIDVDTRAPVSPWGIPTTATAIVANITVTGGTAGSFVTVWPSGLPEPATSNVNFAAGQTIPNLVMIGLGTDGRFSIANAAGAVDVIVDIVGYADPNDGSRFYPLPPTRFLDSRVGLGASGPWGPKQTRLLPIAGGSGIPLGATGIIANMTATGATSGTFITIFPSDVAKPNSSTLNVAPGETIANLTMVRLAADGSIDIANHLGSVDLVADAAGYLAPL